MCAPNLPSYGSIDFRCPFCTGLFLLAFQLLVALSGQVFHKRSLYLIPALFVFFVYCCLLLYVVSFCPFLDAKIPFDVVVTGHIDKNTHVSSYSFSNFLSALAKLQLISAQVANGYLYSTCFVLILKSMKII